MSEKTKLMTGSVGDLHSRKFTSICQVEIYQVHF